MNVHPLPIPVWNQLNDPIPDGSQDVYGAEDCGEECVAMVVYALRDLEMSAGCVREAMKLVGRTGITTDRSLVGFLHKFRIEAATYPVASQGIAEFMARSLPHRQVSIILGGWVLPTFAHWVLAVGMSDHGLIVNDPWRGRQREIAWPDVARLYNDSLIAVRDPVP